MRALDLPAGADTLAAVVLGAVLATVGGVAATLVEHRLRRKERERTAALFFAELLRAVDAVLARAKSARHIGDPFGPLTVRLLIAAEREIETYERSRELLYSLRAPQLRASIQGLMIRLRIVLRGLLDQPPPEGRERDLRIDGFEFLEGLLPRIPPLVRELEALSRERLGAYEED